MSTVMFKWNNDLMVGNEVPESYMYKKYPHSNNSSEKFLNILGTSVTGLDDLGCVRSNIKEQAVEVDKTTARIRLIEHLDAQLDKIYETPEMNEEVKKVLALHNQRQKDLEALIGYFISKRVRKIYLNNDYSFQVDVCDWYKPTKDNSRNEIRMELEKMILDAPEQTFFTLTAATNIIYVAHKDIFGED